MTNSAKTIKTLLVANRGEIACRIIKSARQAGIRTIAVYSTADANALHVKTADAAVCVGSELPVNSYLNISAIIEAALKTNADAIHPGYGFLSENPDFVEACLAANIIFVGPSADAMRAMGLKDAAKSLMESAGVPVVPGYHGEDQAASVLADAASNIGYPVLIKARAGGGGKGMRRVDRPAEFADALAAAQREGQNSFGDATVLIEKYIEHPRHIEVQVFGDTHGNVVHLFERDCSLQRRHQKVLEEAPAPGMSEAMREAMTAAAIQTAKSINYVGAGTVEFIVDASGPLRTDGFWFMEMNTRLQVEHPVTEAVTGIDLVEWQLRVASGLPIPLAQHEITCTGHAVETRLYAEDVDAGFLPATGLLHTFSLSTRGRVDTGVAAGDTVYPYYDPMLAKLIAHASNRDAALWQMHSMLVESVVFGVVTNRCFLSALCANESVVLGNVHTALIDELVAAKSSEGAVTGQVSDTLVAATMALVTAPTLKKNNSVFAQLGAWQLWSATDFRMTLVEKGNPVTLRVQRTDAARWQVKPEQTDEASQAMTVALPDPQLLCTGTTMLIDERRVKVIVEKHGDTFYCQADGVDAAVSLPDYAQSADNLPQDGDVLAPMPGRIVAVNCKVGDQVHKGCTIVTMEAMKMEHNLSASADGEISAVFIAVDDQVELGATLVTLKAAE